MVCYRTHYHVKTLFKGKRSNFCQQVKVMAKFNTPTYLPALFQAQLTDVPFLINIFQKPHQSTLNEVTERSKRDLAMQGHKLDAQSSRPPRRTDGVNFDSPSAVRSTASRSSRTKLPNPPPAVSPSSGPVAHSASSNPRRNPPTVTSETVRSNRGRARPQGISSESRPSNTQASAAPPRKPTTRKKIV